MTLRRVTSYGSSANGDIYAESLCRHAHELVMMGYGRLRPSDHVASQETEITGELVRAMREAMQEASAPDWVARYALRDDPPLDVPGRYGKARPRVDIEFELVRHGTRPLLRFEAKRLGPGHSTSAYLGEDGLGCFLSGKYPLNHPEAGMLGYVQDGNAGAWAKRIASGLNKAPALYFLHRKWRKRRVLATCDHTYRTVHAPPKVEGLVTVHHVLLSFS